MELPDGERGDAARLQVHVGQWPDASEYREDMQDFAQKVLRIQKSPTGRRRRRIENRQQLREIAESAPSSSMVDGPSGLGAILESGKFQVTGSVYFRPLQPFDPDPEVPSEQEFYAEENINFRYS